MNCSKWKSISVTLQQRGCLSGLSAADQTACNLASNKTCYTCDTNLCNNLGREDHTCLVCSSATESKCLNDPLNVNRTRCPTSPALDAFCFTKLVNEKRLLCFDNFLLFLTLFAFCAFFVLHPCLLRGALANWAHYHSTLQHLNSTSRGCLTTNREINECANDKEKCSWCSVDETGACNTVEFPTGRRQCLHCHSSIDENCPTNATSAGAKSIYCDNIYDTCIVINRGKEHGLVQTCVDKISADDNEFCHKNNGSCTLCNENNCNWKKPAEPSSCSRLNVMHATTVFAIAIVGFVWSS